MKHQKVLAPALAFGVAVVAFSALGDVTCMFHVVARRDVLARLAAAIF